MSLFPKFEAFLSNVDDPFPSVPKNGIEGWKRVGEPRPCIVEMDRASRLRYLHSRNEMIYAIACEKFRLGWGEEAIFTWCLNVNEKAFLVSLKRSEVRSVVKSALKRKFPNSCHDDSLQEFCIGHENCRWIKLIKFGATHIVPEDQRFESNWFGSLRSPVREVYRRIMDLEKELKVPPGAWITRSSRQLAQELQFRDKGVVKRSLDTLAEAGLIHCVKPTIFRKPNAISGFATRFCRVIPVPMPGQNKKEGIK